MNQNYDLVNRKQIKEAIRICNMSGSGTFYGKTLDEAIEFWEGKAIKDETLIQRIQMYVDNSDLLSSESDAELLNALISHPENHRLRLITDGSYYTHRICGYITIEGKINFVVDIDYGTRVYDSAFARMHRQLENLTPAEQVNYLFNMFEVVYIQFPVVANNREQIEREIRWEMLDREFERYAPDYDLIY